MDKKEYMEKYELLTGKEYSDFTYRFVCELAKEIKQKFPNVNFTLKIRLKSPTSYEKKVNKYSGEKKDKEIEDIIGIRLIIRRVKSDYTIDDIYGFEDEIIPNKENNREKADKYKELKSQIKDLLNRRQLERNRRQELRERVKKLETQGDDLKLQAEISENEYIAQQEECESENSSYETYISDLPLSSEDMERLIGTVKEKNNAIVALQKKNSEYAKTIWITNLNELKKTREDLERFRDLYNRTKGELYQAFARRIIEYLINNSSVLKGSEFGIETIEGSDEEKRGGKSGKYRAYHYSVKSSVYEGWEAEVQGLSERNHIIATTGDAAHDKSEDKKRYLPLWEKDSEKRETFLEKVKPLLPKTILYIDDGRIYECSDLENFFEYYYNDLMRENEKEKNEESEVKITDELIRLLAAVGLDSEQIEKVKKAKKPETVLPYEAERVKEMLDYLAEHGGSGRFINVEGYSSEAPNKTENDSGDEPNI